MISPDDLRNIMPKAGKRVDRFTAPLNDAMAAHAITKASQQAGFLAQICVESADLCATEENLSYSAGRIVQVWPRRFMSVAEATPFARKPEALANRVYANRMGNGNEASGDGYRYRGRGLLQITGRDNYRKAGFEADPDALAKPEGAAHSAARFWLDHGFNGLTEQVLDRHGFDAVSRKVNGGENGLDARWQAYQRALAVLC